MILEVITPDNLLFKGEIDSLVLPGIDGYFGILNSHSPLISALGNGEVKVQKIANTEIEGLYSKDASGSANFNFDIKGGVVEVLNNKVIVLAE